MVQLLINALSIGCAYALVALGFVFVLNATNAVNFAHGALVVLGSYVAFAIGTVLPGQGLLVFPLALLASTVVGLLLAVVAYFPLRDKPVVTVFISTVSAAAIIENTVLLVFGPEPRATPTLLGNQPLDIGGIVISEQSVAVIGAASVLIVAQYFVLARTRLGKRLRAVAQDSEMAAASGIDVKRMIALTFMLAAALATAAGMLLSATYYVSPADGANYMMKAYLAVTIGGWGSIPGTVFGAFLVALFEILIPAVPAIFPQLANWLPATDVLFSIPASTIALFVAFLLVLVLRPQGLFVEAVKRRA